MFYPVFRAVMLRTVTVLLLSACASGQFVQAGKEESEVQADNTSCVSEVDRLYGRWEWVYRELFPRRFFPPSMLVRRCMESKGYQFKSEVGKWGHPTSARLDMG